jgi:glycogenin glucosyltransferase
LVEFEHLTKDPHPNPPLRALPEHSIPDDVDASEAHPLLSGGASPHGLDVASGLHGATYNSSMQTFASNTSMPPAAQSTGTVDFAQSTKSEESSKNTGGSWGEGLFSSSQDLTSSHSATTSSQQASSSSFQQHSTSQYTSSQTTSSNGQQIQSGKMTFTLPDFTKDNQTGTPAAHDNVLSPTQPEE